MAALGALLQVLRPLVLVLIALGFVSVWANHGAAGMRHVLTLVGIGVVLNLAVWLAARRLWRRRKERR